jgi:hypothetical protein
MARNSGILARTDKSGRPDLAMVLSMKGARARLSTRRTTMTRTALALAALLMAGPAYASSWWTIETGGPAGVNYHLYPQPRCEPSSLTPAAIYAKDKARGETRTLIIDHGDQVTVHLRMADGSLDIGATFYRGQAACERARHADALLGDNHE